MSMLTGWFYPFKLKDGTQVNCMLPEDILPLHETRLRVLSSFASKIKNNETALDLACHQGYFSFELEKYFNSVTGIDRFRDSLDKAEFIKSDKNSKCKFIESTIENYNVPADFVLCYGLLYHVENPIEIFRKIGSLTKHACLIETQVCSTSIPHVEDGTYKSIRSPLGTFALVSDYSDSNIGGLTNIAMVPDINAVVNILKYLGFSKIEIYNPVNKDYEQFIRKQRIIVYAERETQ